MQLCTGNLRLCFCLSVCVGQISEYYFSTNNKYYISVNGRRWKLQVGSKEQQTSHSQRFLILFLLFFWMVHTGGRCSSLSPSLTLTYSESHSDV